MKQPIERAPIIVLTGFLGAGKSTLLRTLMEDPAFAGSGLVINEFGDVAIDHDLLAAGLPEVAVTSTGCICCTAGADIRASVAEVHEIAQQKGRLPLPRIVVETTGLADPAPVVNQLVAGAVPAVGLRDHTVAKHYRLAGVITVFDAVEGPTLLERHPEALKQVAFADRIIITKADLIPAADRAARLIEVRAVLTGINPAATIMDADAAIADRVATFAPRPYAPQDLGDTVEAWLATDHAHHHHHHHHHDHDHDHHHGHAHHHGSEGEAGVSSLGIVRDEPMDKNAFVLAMDLIQMLHGPRLLRMKGIIAFTDEPDTPYVLQAVQHVVHPLAQLPRWPGPDRRTKIVVITFGLDPHVIAELLDAQLTCPKNRDHSAEAVHGTERESASSI